ncbi:MAG: cation:proton antiporter subunit C [Clostridium sp.]|nr:cation:proton antiporter subunit C [Clostridium sp.]
MSHLAGNYYEAAAAILFVVGFLTLLLQKNLIKKIIGINIMDTSVFLFIAAKGFIDGGISPMIKEGIGESVYVNPIPAGLVLTGIVVAVSVTAFALSLSLKIYQRYGSLDIDEIAYRIKLEQEGGEMHGV